MPTARTGGYAMKHLVSITRKGTPAMASSLLAKQFALANAASAVAVAQAILDFFQDLLGGSD